MPDNRKGRNELMDSVALLVVDAQDSFIDTLHNKESFLLRTAFSIEAARSLKIHTIFTEQAPDKLGHANPRLLSLARKPKVFSKRCFSALATQGIEQYLRENEIYHLLVCGLETSICIYQTGLQAVDEDIDITFFTDAIGARRPEDELPVIDSLRRQGCNFLPSETVYYSLLQDVTNPYFRVFNGLVASYGRKTFNPDEFKTAAPQQDGDSESEDVGQAEEPSKDEQGGRRRSRRSRRRRGGRGGDRDRGQEDESKGPDTSEQPSKDQEPSRGDSPRGSQPPPEKQGAHAKGKTPDKSNDGKRAPLENDPQVPPPDNDFPPAGSLKPEPEAPKKMAKKATKKPARKGAKKAPKKSPRKAAKKAVRKRAKTAPPQDQPDAEA